jgi:hypothetical protein
MNIFQVLSQGKSRLNEPSMSAMLGYLLDSNEDHGLGEAFIRAFLSAIDNEVFKGFLAKDFISSRTELEVQYDLNGHRKDIDIEILIKDNENDEEFKIIIENKIRSSAANPKQLRDYYDAILTDDPEIQNLYIVFLTPEDSSSKLKSEYDNLKTLPIHYKKWLFWSSANHKSIISMLKGILNLEMNGEINPINEYMRHTLKAFIKHSSFVTQSNSHGKRISPNEDIGDVIEQIEITMKNGNQYSIIRRDSTQIQVFNIESGEKEIARRIMASYIDENHIGINHSGLNTRTIGKKLLEWHKGKNKND